jgi:hypothetical protein
MKDKLYAFLALNAPTLGVVALIIAAVFLITSGGTR